MRVGACAGGDEAASLLEELRSTGVLPDAACYHAALRACGGSAAGGGAQGEWAALLYDEMAASQLHDAKAAGLALRACVLAGTWREAAQVLEAIYPLTRGGRCGPTLTLSLPLPLPLA